MNDIAVLHVSGGGFAVVDADAPESVFRYRWRRDAGGYIARNKRIGKDQKTTFLHREIFGESGELQVDHINRIKIDNRRCNLRAVTQRQNSANMGKQPDRLSKYKGVTFDKSRGKWAARIKVNYKMINLGRFEDEWDAAATYNQHATKHFGEFAVLNQLT